MKRLHPLRIGWLFVVLALLLLIPLGSAQTTDPTTVIWNGTFYDTVTPGTGNSTTTTYTGLNRNWGSGAPTDSAGTPLPGIPADNWSARFTASATFDAGTYIFTVTADDGVRLLIDGTTVIDNFVANGLTVNSATVVITAGSHNLQVDYFDATGDAQLNVTWALSGVSGTPTVTPPPAVTAQVVRVEGLAVRTGPFLGGSLIAVARPDTAYTVLAFNQQEGLFTWYQIQYDEDTVGWSSGRYLELTGDPSVLPEVNPEAFNIVYDPPGTVYGVTRSVMNFRIFPTPRVPRVGGAAQIPWGATVEILARTVQGGRDFWYQVRYVDENNNSYVGWILAAYVGILRDSDPLDTVPIL